jgi:hypothetical protein
MPGNGESARATDYGDEALQYGQTAVEEPAQAVLIADKSKKGSTPSKTKKDAAPLKTASTLLITNAADAKLRQVASQYAKYVLKLSAPALKHALVTVTSPQGLASEVSRYSRIEHLILMFHGAPGAIEVGTWMSLNDVAKLFSTNIPTIHEITFEGCNIARGPDTMVPFGLLFNASRVNAWNHFWVTCVTEVIIGRDTDVAALNSQLAKFRGYFLPNTPTLEDLAKNPGSYVVVAEWFREDLSDEPIPEAPPPGELDSRKRTFKPRASAQPRQISAKQIAKLIEEYDAATLRFQKVTVTFP